MFRILKSSRFWLLLSGFILTISLWHIQMWKEISINEASKSFYYPYPFDQSDFLKYLYENDLLPNKFKIGIILGIILFISQVSSTFIPTHKKNKVRLRAILNHILFEKFEGDLEHTRITIFKIESGYKFIFIYIWKCFIINLIKHIKRRILFSHIKLMPNPFREYLVIHVRRSQPYENGTSSFFPVANSDKEVCGVASYSLFKGKSHSANSDSISDIDLKPFKSLDDITNGKTRGRVKRYMAANKIKNFNRLKCFHRLSNHFWANPIYDEQEHPWGVVVIDSDLDSNLFTGLESDLISYTRVIEIGVNH
jgi:hypothetical protein